MQLEEASVYIATQNGLFAGTLRTAVDDARPLGLQGMGRVWPIVVDHKDTNRLYAATHRGGIYRSDDRGKTWVEKNNGILYKEAWCIVQHPSTGELYAGTGPVGVFKSVDYAESWTFCEQLHTLPESKEWTFPNPPHIAHVKGLGLSAEDPKRIFGAIEEGWLIRSEDGGATWKPLMSGTEFDAHTVSVMPDNGRVVLSASGKGVFRSDDGGDTFVESNEGLSRRYVSQIVQHRSRPNTLFTAASEVPPYLWRRPEGPNPGFFRSDDQGRHWTRLTNGLPDAMMTAPRATSGDPGDAGTFLAGMTDGSIWATRDSGESFAQIASGLPPIFGITVARN